MTLAAIRINHWSTPNGGTDCLMPEIGFQISEISTLFSPKLAVSYGREWRIGGTVEQPVAPATSRTLMVQAGISLNIGVLSRRLYYRKRRAQEQAKP